MLSKDPLVISPQVRYQLEYARLFDRITDNSKILAATGMKQEELMRFYDAMKLELGSISIDDIHIDATRARINQRMDEFFEQRAGESK